MSDFNRFLQKEKQSNETCCISVNVPVILVLIQIQKTFNCIKKKKNHRLLYKNDDKFHVACSSVAKCFVVKFFNPLKFRLSKKQLEIISTIENVVKSKKRNNEIIKCKKNSMLETMAFRMDLCISK